MDSAGRTTAITVISAVPRWWGWWLRFTFARVRLMRRLRGPSRIDAALDRLSFIHFAHWAIFRRRGLPHPYLLFQSNFNGGAQEYIEAFSVAVRTGMRALWGGAYRVPPPTPVEPFYRYILAERVPTAHYWSAYPHASTTMIRSALRVKAEHDRLAARAADLDGESFAREYRAFLGRAL